MGEKQSNRTFRSPAGEPGDAAADSPELRAQIAALAEQVRRLAAQHAPGVPPAVAPAPVERLAPVPVAPVAPVPVERVPVAPAPRPPLTALRPSAPDAPPPPTRDPLARRTDEVAVDVIAMAERAADEIRDRARREAERIARQHQAARADGAPTLLDIVNRQRRALAVLSAETERIEQSAAILRGQVRALEADLHRVHALLSAPGVSRGTSLHPRA